jgi:hypothetical protein
VLRFACSGLDTVAMRALRNRRAGCFASIAAAVLLGSSSFVHAQPSAPAAAGGSVTGHVTCGDTQRPARFANVILFGVPAEVMPEAKPDSASNATKMVDMRKVADAMRMVQTQTDIDGSFVASRVAPGDYYVFASVPGYVQPGNIVLAAYKAGTDVNRLIPGIPIVHVAAERSVETNLTVERGAAVSGKVVWDDGSPAARVMVSAVAAEGEKKQLPPQFGSLGFNNMEGLLAVSDDLGYFRISGLAPGEYLVEGRLQTGTYFAMQGGRMNGLTADSPLIVFAPAAFHKADAKAITLHTGEERGDVEMTINLAGMHSVSGRVASMEDHHGINAGRVTLEDTQDKEFSRSTGVDAHGEFTVTFVPPSTYNLMVRAARDTEPSKERSKDMIQTLDTTVRSYQDGKQAVVVTDSDVTGQNLELAPLKTVKKELEPTE